VFTSSWADYKLSTVSNFFIHCNHLTWFRSELPGKQRWGLIWKNLSSETVAEWADTTILNAFGEIKRQIMAMPE